MTKLIGAYLQHSCATPQNSISCLVMLSVKKHMNYVRRKTGLCLTFKSGQTYREKFHYTLPESLIQIEG
jgi:hypothetical protein